MTRALGAFAAGLLFAVGLAISGMTQPAKVVGFLDLAGDWDPSLAFVMLGAIGVYAPLSFLILKRRAPVLAPSFDLPTKRAIDARLLAGAAMFGVGWGLGGYCPGPAIVGVGAASIPALVFSAAMIAGMLIQAQVAPRAAVHDHSHQ
jgi:uncharacterized membrane protein YedE/YeeE